MQLKLEVFWSSRLLKNRPNFKAKVGVRLKLEVLRYYFYQLPVDRILTKFPYLLRFFYLNIFLVFSLAPYSVNIVFFDWPKISLI